MTDAPEKLLLEAESNGDVTRAWIHECDDLPDYFIADYIRADLVDAKVKAAEAAAYARAADILEEKLFFDAASRLVRILVTVGQQRALDAVIAETEARVQEKAIAAARGALEFYLFELLFRTGEQVTESTHEIAARYVEQAIRKGADDDQSALEAVKQQVREECADVIRKLDGPDLPSHFREILYRGEDVIQSGGDWSTPVRRVRKGGE